MPCVNPLISRADVVGIPVFGILDRAGGTLPDAILLALFIGAATWFAIWGRAQIKRIDAQQAKRDNEWAESQRKLQDEWEETFATLQIRMKDTFAELKRNNEAAFAEMKRSNDEHLTVIRDVVSELKTQKTQTSECILKHAALEEWKKGIEDRLRDGNKKFEIIEQRIHEVNTKK